MALTTYVAQMPTIGYLSQFGFKSRNGSASVTLLKQAKVSIVADAGIIGIFISSNVLSKVADCYKVCQMLFHFFNTCKHTFSRTHKHNFVGGYAMPLCWYSHRVRGWATGVGRSSSMQLNSWILLENPWLVKLDRKMIALNQFLHTCKHIFLIRKFDKSDCKCYYWSN